MRIFLGAWRDLARLFHGRREGDLPAATARQHVLVALAALAATLVIGVALLGPHVEYLRARARAAQPKPCAPGQASGCVGGTMGVIVVPASAPVR